MAENVQFSAGRNMTPNILYTRVRVVEVERVGGDLLARLSLLCLLICDRFLRYGVVASPPKRRYYYSR